MGTKRQYEDEGKDSSSKKSTGFWALGLISAMKDPNLIIEEDEEVVVIKDKYAKAKYHYLVLPKEDISSLNKVTKSHLPLLQHMHDVGVKMAEKHPEAEMRLGYHAVASMARLHLHVISQDFDSPCLKSKKHWNSFTTKFFIPSEDIIAEVEKTGRVFQITSEAAKKLLDTPLKCHKCDFQPPNMPKLKLHIQTHYKK
ncbi:aprataxin isoform X1 [Anabrus simplex]|uniref:aprataxin isoform X1 n=1 Tax=Anabrus simplex TaxID=316456 RepID=UPI0034DCCCDE